LRYVCVKKRWGESGRGMYRINENLGSFEKSNGKMDWEEEADEYAEHELRTT